MKNNYKILSVILLFLSILGVYTLYLTGFNKIFSNTCIFLNLRPQNIINQQAEETAIIDKFGNRIGTNLYQKVTPLNNFYLVMRNNKVGIVDNKGKTIIPIQFDSIWQKYDYFIAVNYNNGLDRNKTHYVKRYDIKREMIFDLKGKPLFNGKYSQITLTYDYIILSKKDFYSIYQRENKKHLFNTTSEIQPKAVDKNVFAIKRNNKFLIINEKGKNIIADDYEYLGCNEFLPEIRYKKSILFRIKRQGKWGIIDINNKEIVPIVYDELISSNKDSLWVKKGEKWGRINYQNEILTDFIFDVIPELLGNDLYIKAVREVENVELPIQYNYRQNPPQTLKEPPINRPIEKPKSEVYGDLHVLSVYEGGYKEPRKFQEHKLGEVVVKVEVVNKPITLFLSSYEPVRWIIETKPNVKIKKIYFSGYYDGDVIIKNKLIPIEKMESRIYLSKEDAKVEKYMNKPAKTFQYKYGNDYFTIDDKKGTL